MRTISLGSTCAIAEQMRRHGVKRETLPFDWIKSYDFSKVVYLIINRFHNFFKEEEYVFQKESDKFPVDVEGEPSFDEDNLNKSAIYKHSSYQMEFPHDFISFEESFEYFKDKYSRRIDRLYYYLLEDEKIHFIRDEMKPNKLDPESVREFISFVEEINPDLDFMLTIIIHDSKNKKGELVAKLTEIEKVTVYHDIERFTHWTRPNVRWDEIF